MTLAPFHTPCARKPAPFLEQAAIRNPMVLMEIDGGMSTLLPRSGLPVGKVNQLQDTAGMRFQEVKK
jgi:hypothetical protein